MAVVKQNGYALKFVKDQTEEICLAAVKQNWQTFERIRDNSMRKKIIKMNIA